MAEIRDLDAARPDRQAAACTICGRPAVAGYRPFCSARCKSIDLGRWLDGRYRIASEEVPDEQAFAAAAAAQADETDS